MKNEEIIQEVIKYQTDTLEVLMNKAREDEKKRIFKSLKCPECNKCETVEEAWDMLCKHIEKVEKDWVVVK